MNNPTIADWLIAGGTIALAFLVVFQDIVRGWLKRPKLDVKIKLEPPDCHKIRHVEYGSQGEQRVVADSYYFRLRVENSGKERAERVEVFVDKLKKRQADGHTFRDVSEFVPMNLVWSHTGIPGAVFYPSISPKMYRHCELGHIVDPQKRAEFTVIPEYRGDLDISSDETLLHIATMAKPHSVSYLQPPGVYHLELTVGASNAQPKKRKFEITLTGRWSNDEATMLSEGIGIRRL